MTRSSAEPEDAPPPETAAATDVSIPMERAALLGLYLFPALALPLLPFVLLHGWGAVWEGVVTAFTPWIFVPALLVSIVVHEALHAVGFLLFGRVPRRALHFGVDRSTLSPYAGCRAPVSVAAYRGAVALPGLLLGVLPLLAGTATGHGFAAVWGTFMIQSAAGDLIVLWTIRSLPGGARVVDHPSRVGCRVLHASEPDAATPAAAER